MAPSIIFPITTASKKGIPDVTSISFVMLVKDDMVWMADNFMHKTLADVTENLYIAVYLCDSGNKKCCQVKGTVEVKTSRADYNKMKRMVQEKKTAFRQNHS
jgi:predicted pyridoxine 5'-phosphate oxidase superfamily flavin-nucleotide-binding protein